jgi:LuxR family maltose regulon positive regulatory protein
MMRRVRRTKLYRPLVSPDHVHRPRLIEILDAGFQAPLTLVSAPAGYGKSQLCSSWLQMCGLRSAWLNLDDDDDDLRRFLEHVLASVGSEFPEVLGETRSLVEATTLPPLSALVDSLANDLERIEDSFVFVVDDFHRIRSAPIHDLMAELLRHPPRPMHIVLITRRDPPLPLARFRAEGRLTEVRTRNLQFTDAEVAELLDRLTGETLGADGLAQVQRQMEGWVVGLRLVALALRHTDSPDALMAGMSGEIPDIREYLLSEVLAAQTSRIQDYMLKSSILDRFCAPLCTTLCRVEDPAAGSDSTGDDFLDAIQRSGVFTIPLDNEGRWFRFHHLFQELLTVELKQRFGPKEIAELHTRAARWFEDHDLVDEAIDHSIASGDQASAADIVERHIRPEMSGGSWYTVKEWLNKLPESEIESRPELLLGRAFTYAFSANFRRVPAILDRIDALMGGADVSSSQMREVSAFRGVCALHTGEADRAVEHLEKALDRQFAGHPNLGSMIVAHFTIASQMAGRMDRARAMTAKWLDDEPSDDRRTVFLHHGLRLQDLTNADLARVERGLESDRHLANTLRHENTVAWCDYLAGMCRLHRGLFGEAIPFLEAAVERKYRHWKQCAIDAQAALAIAYQAHGFSENVDEALETMRGFVSHMDSTQSISADSCETRVRIMRGVLEPGGWWREALPTDTMAPMFFFLDVPKVTRCRALVAEETAAGLNEAIGLLQRYMDLNVGHHNLIRQIELCTLQAAAFDKLADNDSAVAALDRAVELAAPGGFVFLFLEFGSPMSELLKRCQKTSQHAAHIERILAAFETWGLEEPASRSHRLREARPPREQLTRRELEVLELLEQRLFDKEIAARLHISASTVNSHCKNIYQKLDVGNRRQAVATAIELGILSGRPN